MSYNNTIPQPTNLMSNSQAQIFGNFAAIDSGTTGTGAGFSRNHVTMTDGTNGGLHHRVDYYQAVASPAISGFAASLYPKTVTNVEACFKNTVADIQITNSTLTTASGEGMMPGGVQVRCGLASSNGSGVTTNFTTAFPVACLSVVVTGRNTSLTTNIIKVTGKTRFDFTLQSPSGENAYYVAIGY